MKALILISCFSLSIMNGDGINAHADVLSVHGVTELRSAPGLSIIYPKNNQKVRGEYKIYGKARPGAVVQLHISSSYYKTSRDNQGRVAKGAGPITRMNRKFSLTADRSGNWILKKIDLLNAGWEENYTIKATADKKTVSIRVYDNTRPVAID